MELKEYIKQSYLRPNKQVLKSLGASDELIEYLRTTPWNTNLNIIDSFISNESSIVLFEGEAAVVDMEYGNSVMANLTLSDSTPKVGDTFRVTTDIGVIDGTVTSVLTTGYNVNYPPIGVDMYAQKYQTAQIYFPILRPTKITKVELIQN